MNNTITHFDSRVGIAALAVTLAAHIVAAAGIIWGGWMEIHPLGFNPKPREVLITLNMSDTFATPPNTAVIPAEQKEEKKHEPEKPKKIQKPNIFVPVNPESTTPDPSEKNTPFYSNANTKAANEKPETTSRQQPLIDGENELFPGTFNNSNSSLNPIPKSATQPAQAATVPRPMPRAQLLPQKTAKITHEQVPVDQGALPQARSEQATLTDAPQPNDTLGDPLPLQEGTANNSFLPTLPEGPEKAKAPTIAEQKRRLEVGRLASRKMKQPGGVARIGIQTLDVRLTGYGDYDARFVQSVRLAWLRFRDKPGWFHPGKVVVDFKLHHDGTISELAVQQNLATIRQGYYCKEALTGPAPFEKWTGAMRREIGSDVRACRFSFRYLIR
jgi:hypothetical protein